MKWLIYLGAAMLAGAVGSAMLGPAPAGAVNRDMVELQQNMTQLIQGQQALQTAMTQNDTVIRTLVGQAVDSVNKLNGSMGSLQKSVEDLQATSGARLDSMATQVQGVSDNLQEALARMGRLNQQLTDVRTAVQAVDAKIASVPPPAALPPAGFTLPPSGAGALPPANNPSGPAAAAQPSIPAAPPAASLPSADLLYSNGLRDLNGKKYELATQEFHDYIKYFGDSDLASNAQFYLGEIAYAEMRYQQAVDAYSMVIDNYPKSFKLAPAHLKRGLALVALNQKAPGIRELRSVVRLYPGTDEERRARAKLRELGVDA